MSASTPATILHLLCPYCGEPATLHRDSSSFYNGHNYGPLWACVPCGAWVGCHKGTETPLGRLADGPLRRAKMRAHAAFDPLWRSAGATMTRSQAYEWLASKLRIQPSACHIGYFDTETCEAVVAICRGLAARTQPKS